MGQADANSKEWIEVVKSSETPSQPSITWKIFSNDKVDRETMAFHLSPATPADASPIASLHLSAFNSNPLLHVQFPSASSLQSLKEFLVQNTLRDLSDPGKVVLVVRDGERIVGFASWELPGDGEGWERREWPEDCDKEWLNEYYEKVGGVRNRVVGNQKCYGKRLCSLIFKKYLLS